MENEPNEIDCRECKSFWVPSCGCRVACLEETVPYGEGCSLHQKREEETDYE